MVWSRNVDVLPMRGTVERETRRKAIEAQAVRLLIEGFNQPPEQLGQLALEQE